MSKVCKAWFFADVVSFCSVALGAERLKVPITMRATYRERDNVIRASVSVASFSTVLADVLVACEHDAPIYFFGWR